MVSGLSVFALPSASGLRMTRHPQMGAAEQLSVNAGELAETKPDRRLRALQTA